MQCKLRPCCSVLISWLTTLSWVNSRLAAKRLGVGKMLSTCSEYELQWTSCACWQRLLLFVARSSRMCENRFDLQCIVFLDISDGENVGSVKDKAFIERCLPPVTAVCIWRSVYQITFHDLAYFRRLCFHHSICLYNNRRYSVQWSVTIDH